MDNQHRKINGYNELSQDQIDLMNEVKQKETEVLALHAKVTTFLRAQAESAEFVPADKAHIKAAEPGRWASIGKTDIETGFMALARAVAQPGPRGAA